MVQIIKWKECIGTIEAIPMAHYNFVNIYSPCSQDGYILGGPMFDRGHIKLHCHCVPTHIVLKRKIHYPFKWIQLTE